MLGKDIDELQKDVTIGVNNIAGTSHYVTGYTGFSGDPTEQEGNYLALHIDSNIEGSTITVKTDIGDGHPRTVTLDADRTLIIRIRSKLARITITSEKEGYETVTRTFNISSLVLEKPSA